MRFHQPVGVIHRNNCHINGNNNNINSGGSNITSNISDFVINTNSNNQVTHGGTIFYRSENENDEKCLKTLKSIIHERDSENINNFDSRDVNRFEKLLKFKANSTSATCGYFKNFFDIEQREDINIDLNGNDNDNVLLIETLNLTEDNLSRFVSSTTTAYDNCVTNQSYKQQNCLSTVQRKRRGNLIKLEFGSMTKHEGPSLQSNGGDSAGCSVESSPVDSLLDDQELVSPTPSSLADLSSPDTQDLEVFTRHYPRGIINPNYPGFQHLAHTLAEHFIDHHLHHHNHQQQHNFEGNSSDSEISDDIDFDVTYRSGNLMNVNNNIMNDSNNNNNDNINNNDADVEAHDGDAIDLNRNRNKNRNNNNNSLSNMREQQKNNTVNDFDMSEMKIKEYEDGNVNLLMKSEPKVFCESKQLGLHVDEQQISDYEHYTSSDDEEDEECCNVEKASVEPQQMDFDDDEMADLSGEDDAAIKNELERIDRADNDFSENINCDLATYLQQYDYKMDLQKSYQLDIERMENETEEECLTDEDNNKLPTPDILIEHNNSSNKKLQNDMTVDEEDGSDCDTVNRANMNQCNADVSSCDDCTRNFQPDLIKNIADTISTNDNNHHREEEHEQKQQQANNNGSDNGISSLVEHEISNIVNETNDNDEKIINQVQTECKVVGVETLEMAMASSTTKLSFDSASSAVDIIGDFGKEVEKEIGLIVSGYLNATNDESSPSSELIRPSNENQQSSARNAEVVFDENKFIEHLKYFSKMGDAALSKVEEKIILRNTSVEADDSNVNNHCESLIPTAIVKPKYQKLSFDERQLPIRGATEVDSNLWNNSSNSATTTITTTPRKVQKHLPKSQKSFTKHSRKLVNSRASETCSMNYDVINKTVAINSIHQKRKDIDCQIQNSVAIVQPIKKVIDTNIEFDVEKIECSKNSAIELKIRNSSKTNTANETAPKIMNDCGNNNNNNLNNNNIGNRKIFEREKNVVVASLKESGDDKKVPTKIHKDNADAFDVYNIETALPVIDLEAIEHLMASAKEEEMKRKNDREAIRRRLAMGEEDDYLAASTQRPIRKPNLQSRLQNGMNLQICFMNEAASDSESSDSETCPKLSQGMSKRKQQRPSSLMSHRTTALNNNSNPYNSRPLSVAKSVMDRNEKAIRPVTLTLSDANDNNFFTHQARLQIEARMALSQAKDMAHMQMEFERQKQVMCPITMLVHQTLEKISMKVPHTKRRLSRQMLTNMNIAQLQIIINEFHSFIEMLNETLVRYLMDRDDLSMRQDSMLIDIEDITRYLAEKEEAQLNNRSSQQRQQQHIDPIKTLPNHRTTATTKTTVRHQQTPINITYQQNINNNNNSNKKSLVVNGNGHSSVITSISREKFEQRNRLHL